MICGQLYPEETVNDIYDYADHKTLCGIDKEHRYMWSALLKLIASQAISINSIFPLWKTLKSLCSTSTPILYRNIRCRPSVRRIISNAERLKYTTTWIKAQNLQSDLLKHKIYPTSKTADGSPYYTVPAIVDTTKDSSNPVIIADSAAIIEYLESQYPDLLVFPKTSGPALHLLVAHHLSKTVIPIIVGLTRRSIFGTHIHNSNALAYFDERMGVPVEQIEPGPVGGKEWEDVWKQVEGEFDALARFLTADPAGRASQADYMLLSVMAFSQNASPNEAWARMSTWSRGRWARFWDACEGMGLLKSSDGSRRTYLDTFVFIL